MCSCPNGDGPCYCTGACKEKIVDEVLLEAYKGKPTELGKLLAKRFLDGTYTEEEFRKSILL